MMILDVSDTTLMSLGFFYSSEIGKILSLLSLLPDELQPNYYITTESSHASGIVQFDQYRACKLSRFVYLNPALTLAEVEFTSRYNNYHLRAYQTFSFMYLHPSYRPLYYTQTPERGFTLNLMEQYPGRSFINTVNIVANNHDYYNYLYELCYPGMLARRSIDTIIGDTISRAISTEDI